MTWTNAFDTGPCEVAIFCGDQSLDAPTWEGTLGKDESETFPAPYGEANTLTVAVDINGVVSLTGTFNPVDTGFYFEIGVSPATNYIGSRIAGVVTSANSFVAMEYGDAWSGDSLGGEIEITRESPPDFCLPNPAVAVGAPLIFGLYAEFLGLS